MENISVVKVVSIYGETIGYHFQLERKRFIYGDCINKKFFHLKK